MTRYLRLLNLSFLSLLITGCYHFQSASGPLEVVQHTNTCDIQSKKAIVLLPGMGDSTKEFEAYGTVSLMTGKPYCLDVIAVNAHLNYYKNRSILPRLHDEVIVPAKARGYTSIDMAGISLGGYGAILYARKYEDSLNRIILMAPYLGTSKDIKAAEEGCPNTLGDTNVWPWIYTHSQPKKLFLGYGMQDRFVEQQAVLATFLTSNNVASGDGKHNWKAWQPLWQPLLNIAYASEK